MNRKNTSIEIIDEAAINAPIEAMKRAVIAEFKAVIEAMTDEIKELRAMCDELRATIEEQGLMIKALEEGGASHTAAFGEMAGTVDDLKVKVEGRNKSAAVKRNMTDADALTVLTGSQKEVSHKDAAEVIGLTYAQVYSCRMEYTFKHVHRELKMAQWTNPWVKTTTK